jgi:hypothetical protein
MDRVPCRKAMFPRGHAHRGVLYCNLPCTRGLRLAWRPLDAGQAGAGAGGRFGHPPGAINRQGGARSKTEGPTTGRESKNALEVV